MVVLEVNVCTRSCNLFEKANVYLLFSAKKKKKKKTEEKTQETGSRKSITQTCADESD